MSMILDALSRAEKERQSENTVGLDTARYATSSTIKEDRFKKWVLIALVANFALIIFLSLGYAWKTYLQADDAQLSENNQPKQIMSVAMSNTVEPEVAIPAQVESMVEVVSEQLAPQSVNLSGVSNKTSPASSLLDEAQVQNKAVKKIVSKKSFNKVVKKIPPVQYSSKPLSQSSQASKPTVASVTAALERERAANASYSSLNDLPATERTQLSQFEVNVHVYDDSGQGSFVLINMVKYKEGDQLPGGRAIVSSIVPEGVVVDYGNGKALLERNQ